ncbi:hypothetical protein B0187_00155 [Haemophilus paracuniculus]|uniref:Uncharacterized protein n=1 Tax=Haemophilus paracuniculus TaxID=734 RepID=A0A1T0AUY1_9PAST|nr:hypothetical protein B0187_00155 [Haemophilus paracuniculus]
MQKQAVFFKIFLYNVFDYPPSFCVERFREFQGQFVLFEPACWRVYKLTAEIRNKRNNSKMSGSPFFCYFSLAKQRKVGNASGLFLGKNHK